MGKFALIGMIDDYVSGNVLRAAEMHDATAMADTTAAEATLRFVRSQVETGDYPHTAAAFAGEDAQEMWARIAEEESAEQRFETGLQALLDGVTTRFGLST
jgi:hypothetical protein